MLNRDIEEILYDENGNFRGIKSQGEEAYGKILITEPSNVQKWNKIKYIGKIIRRICILDHPIPKTNDVASCQIILPQKQINRENDIFIAVINFTHCFCKKGYYLDIFFQLRPKQIIQLKKLNLQWKYLDSFLKHLIKLVIFIIQLTRVSNEIFL